MPYTMENISLVDLLNLAIGTPSKGAVNFSALYALLNSILRQLDIREVKTEWTDTSPRYGPPETPSPQQVDKHTEEEKKEKQQVQSDISTGLELEVQPGTELQQRVDSSMSLVLSSGPAADGQGRLLCRIQTCEDGLSEAMKLIQELNNQGNNLKEERKDLCQQQVGAEAVSISEVEKCCHQVDALQEAVKSLKDAFQKFPAPEELSECVTWDVMQSSLLSEREILQKDLVNSGLIDRAKEIRPTHTPFHGSFTAANTTPSHTSTPASPSPLEDPSRPTAPGSLDTEAPSAPSGPPQQTDPETDGTAAATLLPRKASGSERYTETVDALRNMGKLKESFSKLEARVAALEQGKLEPAQLKHLKELITNKGSRNASNNMMDQLNQQKALIDNLMKDRDKLDSLEDMFMNMSSQDKESSSEAAPGSEEADSKASLELRQQISYLRRSVQKLEEDLKQLKAQQALTLERTEVQHLQNQLDDLRGMLEDMTQSLTSDLSEVGQHEGDDDSQGLGSAFTGKPVNVARKLSLLFQHYEQLQDAVSSMLQQQSGGRAQPPNDGENGELVNDVQNAILQLQTDCEKLTETTRCLHEDNSQKQSHIEELYKTTEELQEKKADKQMVESEIKKASKCGPDGKVSRLQFDSVTEQLNAMFQELLNKVTGQEQDWHKVIERLSSEMECKLNRIELNSVKKQLEDRWRSIQEKLQGQGTPEQEDAAGIRKQLVDRFHCLSCDRPVVMHNSGQHMVKLSSTAGFPSHKSIRPFTVYALEQFRQHYRRMKPGSNRYSFDGVTASWKREQLQKSHDVMCRQIERDQRTMKNCNTAGDNLNQNQPGILHERVSEMTDYSHLAVLRSCGGSHTVTTASQRRTNLQTNKYPPQAEVDCVIQSEEVDIVGLDGHIYKGRLNAPSIRNTETKLPTIPTKDGMCKTKDKAKCPHKPTASPEGHHPHSAKSNQGSHSVSSLLERDWPVSALGCTSQSSVAAAESNTEPPAGAPLDL
nr:glutamine-rich protein 2 isoform X1 [Pseudochaenichthys georgianus]